MEAADTLSMTGVPLGRATLVGVVSPFVPHLSVPVFPGTDRSI
ncbi:hypothetical protein ACWZEH_31170 [Streptomyces sp. QTS137]